MRIPLSIRAALYAAVLASLPPGAAATQETPQEPDVKLGSGRSLDLEGQLQVQAASSPVDDAVTWDVELRRMRLTAIADAGGGFFGTLQTDFGAERVRVRDAFIEFRPSDRFALRVGQFKVPFNGIELVSSKRLLVIERGDRIRGLDVENTSTFLDEVRLSARNRGFMATLHLAGDRLTLYGGGWQGSGENPDDNDGKEVAARVEYSVLPLPEKASRPLVVAAAVVANGYLGSPDDTLVVADGDTVSLLETQVATALEGWVEYGKYLLPGPHVAANVIVGDNPLAFQAEGDGLDFRRFLGLQGWGELVLETGADLVTAWAPAFRVDRFDPDTDAEDDANLLLTPGLNLYFGSNVKAQLNLDVNVPDAEDRDTEAAFRVQTQLLF